MCTVLHCTHCTVYNVHCTMCTVQCVDCTMYTVQSVHWEQSVGVHNVLE